MQALKDCEKTHYGELSFKKRERISSSQEKREFISSYRSKFRSIEEVARLMGMSRTAYYYKQKGKRRKR